jgi:hypothetical protein
MPAATFNLCGRHVLIFIPAVLRASKPARPLPLAAVSQYLWQQDNEVDAFI